MCRIILSTSLDIYKKVFHVVTQFPIIYLTLKLYFIILNIQNISKKYYKNMNNKQLAHNLDDGTKNCTPIANVTFCGTFFGT